MAISKQILTETPIGPLLIVANDHALLQLCFVDDLAFAKAQCHDSASQFNPIIEQTKWELSEYFSGSRHRFTVPIELHGTPFQIEVWQALQQIPWGKKASYGELARQLGRPQAARAVGMANNRNPLPIIIPCHRVIGANGKLVGYRGGLAAKQALLAIEQKVVSAEPTLC